MWKIIIIWDSLGARGSEKYPRPQRMPDIIASICKIILHSIQWPISYFFVQSFYKYSQIHYLTILTALLYICIKNYSDQYGIPVHPCSAEYNIRGVLQVQLWLSVHANKIRTYNIMYILFEANIIQRLYTIHLFYLERQIIILQYFNVILIYVLSPCKMMAWGLYNSQ